MGNLSPIIFILLIVLASVLFFLALWFGIIATAAKISGWARLAEKYPAPENFSEGRLFTKETGRCGNARYKRALNVRVAPEGLYIASAIPPKRTHPPLLIPWPEIKNVSEQNAMSVTIYNFAIGEPPVTTIGFWNPEILKAAQPYLPSSIKLS